MKKNALILAGLATVAVVAYVWYTKKTPNKNSEGFYNASGLNTSTSVSPNCARCRNQATGNTYRTGDDRSCNKGDTCVAKYAFASA